MAAGPHLSATGATRQAVYAAPVVAVRSSARSFGGSSVSCRTQVAEDVSLWSKSEICGDSGISRDWKQNGRRRRRERTGIGARTGRGTGGGRGGGGIEAMIREVVTVGTAAATVTSTGGHHVVLRVALYTVTQVAVTAVTAAVCYGAYLSPYAEGLKNRVKVEEECPGE